MDNIIESAKEFYSNNMKDIIKKLTGSCDNKRYSIDATIYETHNDIIVYQLMVDYHNDIIQSAIEKLNIKYKYLKDILDSLDAEGDKYFCNTLNEMLKVNIIYDYLKEMLNEYTK